MSQQQKPRQLPPIPEDEAARAEMFAEQRGRILDARARLIWEKPFIGSIMYRLAIKPVPEIGTAGVDGVNLFFNPAFIATLSNDELFAVAAHEVLHVANMHHLRREERHAGLWNIATDFAINGILAADGFKLPEGGLIDRQYDGLSAETIYDRLEQNAVTVTISANGSEADPSGMGGVIDQPSEDGDEMSPAEKKEAEAEMNVAISNAVQTAKAQGKFPAALKRMFDTIERGRVDWKAILRDMIQATIPHDYSWTRPNRRHIAAGVYMPGTTKENVGPIVVAIDTSGSIDRAALSRFMAELSHIHAELECEAVHVVACDARVHNHATFQRGEEIAFTPHGGGGTDFAPVFDWIEAENIEPVALVYFTDLYGNFPQHEPSYRTLWAATENSASPPWGECVRLNP